MKAQAICSCCQRALPTEAFGPDRRCRTGLQARCRECSWAAIKKFREEHPERHKSAYRKWYLTHPEKVREKNAAWRADPDHRERARQRTRVWRQANPERTLFNSKTRRARMRVRDTDITPGRWQERIAEFGGRCAYCASASDTLQMDHMTPISRGGPHVMDNVVPACRTCNSSKNVSTVLGFLLRRRPSHVAA